MLGSLAVTLSLYATSAAATSSALVVHETLKAIPDGFSALGPASGDSVLSLRLALRPRNTTGLEKVLYEASTPGNDAYGKHLSREEVAAFVRPSNLSKSLVTEWLSSNQLNATWNLFSESTLQISLPVSKANKILGADFHLFRRAKIGTDTIRTLSYSIPAALKGHLDHVHPTINFPVTPALVRTTTAALSNGTAPGVPITCHEATTPTCILDLYGVPTTPATQSTNKFFVSGLAGNYANKQDLKAFFGAYRPDLSPDTSFSLISVDNGTNSQNVSDAGTEATLDIQYALGVATNVPTTFISVGPAQIKSNDEFWDALQDELNYVLAMDSPPTVLTSSYGSDENTVSRSLASTICDLYMQLGARGVSVLTASGDGGVSGGQLATCKDNLFVPTFPASCPYVTAVGASQLEKTGQREEAADFGNGYSTSGGFSNFFAAPSYQLTQVSSYIKSLNSSYAGLYNASGRGFPDVSALGVNYAIVYQGNTILINGTSASAPTFAAILAMVNDRRLAAGNSSMGFLNPLLYYAQGTAALTDIVSGHNPGCNTTGFSAGVGWDPVTGLGTPIFSGLLKAFGV